MPRFDPLYRNVKCRTGGRIAHCDLDLFFGQSVTPENAGQAIAAYCAASISFVDEKLGFLLDAPGATQFA